MYSFSGRLKEETPGPINIHAVSHTPLPPAPIGQRTGRLQNGMPAQGPPPFRQRWARNVKTPHPSKPTCSAQVEAQYRQKNLFAPQAEIKALIEATFASQEGGRTPLNQASGVAQSLPDTPTQAHHSGGITYGPDGQSIRVPLPPVLPAIPQTPRTVAMQADTRSNASYAAHSNSRLSWRGFDEGADGPPSVVIHHQQGRFPM